MHKFFKEYKNKHEGEVAYIFGSGPSLNSFVEQEPGVYIAGNNAHRNKKVSEHLQYMFFLYRGYKNYYNNKNTVYGDYCQNFRDMPPNIRKFCCLNFTTKMDEPTVSHIKNEVSNVDFYRVSSDFSPNKIDISEQKLWNFSIVFGMVQFALHAGFEKIYLVGCDCTSGYFFDTKYGGEHYHQYEPYVERWRDMKRYLTMYHPKVNVTSLNPEGLVGMFNDEYTIPIRTISGPGTRELYVYKTASKINYMLDYKTEDLISKVTLEKGGWGIKYNNFASKFVKKGTIIIDVGANIGSFTLPLAKMYPDCAVHSFEAQRLKSYQLSGNVYLNDLKNVAVHNYALTDTTQFSLPFVIAPDSNNGASRLLSEAKITNFEGSRVENVLCKRLDDIFFVQHYIPDVSLIKIDVEGHEENVIRGGVNTINKYHPIILFECWEHEWAKEKRLSLMTYLSTIDYDIFRIDHHEYIGCHKSKNNSIFRELLTNSIKILK